MFTSFYFLVYYSQPDDGSFLIVCGRETKVKARRITKIWDRLHREVILDWRIRPC